MKMFEMMCYMCMMCCCCCCCCMRSLVSRNRNLIHNINKIIDRKNEKFKIYNSFVFRITS